MAAEEILETAKQEAIRGIEQAKSTHAKIAWWYTHVGEIEMTKFLGHITEERRAELMEEWKRVKRDLIQLARRN